MKITSKKINMNQKLILILCFYLFIGCSTKKNVSLQSKPAVPASHIDSTNIHLNSSDPFYPLKESIHDLQNQISDLKSQVVEYESRLHNPLVDTELIKLIKTPDLKNELRTQITEIMGYTELLREAFERQAGKNKDFRQDIENIWVAVRAAHALLNCRLHPRTTCFS